MCIWDGGSGQKKAGSYTGNKRSGMLCYAQSLVFTQNKPGSWRAGVGVVKEDSDMVGYMLEKDYSSST